MNINIKNLVHAFSKLPSLGPSSSQRLAIHLLQNKEKVMLPLASLIRELADLIIECKICRNLDTKLPCSICINPKRDTKLMCVVEELGDLWAFEKGNIYSSMYHVLDRRLSAAIALDFIALFNKEYIDSKRIGYMIEDHLVKKALMNIEHKFEIKYKRITIGLQNYF